MLVFIFEKIFNSPEDPAGWSLTRSESDHMVLVLHYCVIPMSDFSRQNEQLTEIYHCRGAFVSSGLACTHLLVYTKAV